MFNDLLNFRRLDRFRQVGRGFQFVGVASSLGPILAASIRTLGPVPAANPMLDALPPYNPTAFSFRHPLWVAAIGVPLGLVLVVIGTQFLASRPWAWVATKVSCWVYALAMLVHAGLWALSLRGPAPSGGRTFGLMSIAVSVIFAGFLVWLVGQLNAPEIRVRFKPA